MSIPKLISTFGLVAALGIAVEANGAVYGPRAVSFVKGTEFSVAQQDEEKSRETNLPVFNAIALGLGSISFLGFAAISRREDHDCSPS